MLTTKYEGGHKFSVLQENISEPEKGEVRIKVAFCGVCGTDLHIYHGTMDARIAIPQTIGHEMSGVIDAIGPEVENFKIGEKVVVRPLDNRGEKPSDKGFSHICKDLKFIGIDSPGAMQEYWNVPAFTCHSLPESIDLKLAALIEPLAVACHDVRMSGLNYSETAVVIGGGPIGLLVAMVANNTGAQVIISELNPVRIALAREMGFKVVNPKEEDLTAIVNNATEEKMADVVFEVAGVQAAIDTMTDLAGIRGRIVMVAIHGQKREMNLFQFFWKELKLIGARVYEKEDYEEAISLIYKNELPFQSLITDVKPLNEIQSVFENIDKNPNGMKVLLDCQAK